MQEKIINIPNIITLCRFLLIPFFIFSLIQDKIDIAILFCVAIIGGDLLDGLSARLIRQKTNIGFFLDSTTDIFFMISTLIVFVFFKRNIPLSVFFVFIIPAIIINLAKLFYIKKKKEIQPTVTGKITGAFAYLTIIAILIDYRYKELFLMGTIIMVYALMITHITKDVKLFIK